MVRGKVLKDDDSTETLQVVDGGQLVHLHVVLARHVGDVHEDGHAVAAHRQHRCVVDRTQVAGTCVAVVLDAVKRVRGVPAEDVDATVEGTTRAHALLPTVAGNIDDNGNEEGSVLAVGQVLHAWVEDVVDVGHG